MKAMKSKSIHLAAATIAISILGGQHPAKADLSFCGSSFRNGDVYIAVAYKDNSGQSDRRGAGSWRSHGWYKLKSFPSRSCVTPIKGNLRNRFYYYHVTGAHTFDGNNEFCVRNGSGFELVDADTKCSGSNAEWRGFREIDTGDSADYTVRLNAR